MEEPHRVEEAADAAGRLFTQSVAAMLERGEGNIRAVGAANDGGDAVPPPAYAANGAAVRACAQLPAHPRAGDLQFDARAAPQYPGERAELARDIGLSRRTGAAVLLFAGAHAPSA